jgi:hypothetical protein
MTLVSFLENRILRTPPEVLNILQTRYEESCYPHVEILNYRQLIGLGGFLVWEMESTVPAPPGERRWFPRTGNDVDWNGLPTNSPKNPS